MAQPSPSKGDPSRPRGPYAPSKGHLWPLDHPSKGGLRPLVALSGAIEGLGQGVSRGHGHFQRALVRAYNAFARNYPDLTGQFFTEPFLLNEAAPILAQALTREGMRTTDPIEFAQLWVNTERNTAPDAARALCDGDGKPKALAIEASSQFLTWLDGELRREPIFQPLYDSRALARLHELQALPEMTALLRQIVQALQRDEAAAKQYQTTIESTGGAVVGGQVTVSSHGAFVGRDQITYNFLAGGYAHLRDLYKSSSELFRTRKIDRFVGRRELKRKIDAFLDDPERASGMFVVEGEAGVAQPSPSMAPKRFFRNFDGGTPMKI